jgi:tRNA U34 5-methylaminomethyl-2-thiouridine-forming methyltransferase MnmC
VTDLPQRHIVQTADGSATLYVPQWDEHYHSIHGAVQESEHVFIKAGLEFISPLRDELSVLEIGFGTGLNAWLTAKWAIEHHSKIQYTSLEAYPLTVEESSLLQYSASEEELQLFNSLHVSPWGKWNELNQYFSLFKWKDLLEDWNPECQYDLIYFDAFAPSAQPELWTKEVFEKMFQCTYSGGVLVTYCAKGDARRALKAAGWEVSKLPGPPRKREMTRAIRP